MAAISHVSARRTAAGNGTWAYVAGLGASVQVLPAGAYLLTVAAFAAAAGGTVQIGAGAAVSIPPSGSVSIDVGGGIVGAPTNITFAGLAAADGWFVDWITIP